MTFKSRNNTLFIRGGPDSSNTMSLYTGPLGNEGDSTDKPKIPLTMAAQPGGVITLTVGPNGIVASGNPQLSINGSYGSGVGLPSNAEDYQGYATLQLQGTAGISATNIAPLYIDASELNSQAEERTLFINASPQPAASGDISLFVTATQISASGDSNITNIAPLYVRSNPNPNSNITLKVKTDFDTNRTATLYIADVKNNNNIPVVMLTKGEPSGVLPLTMKSEDVSNIKLYTKGFLE